MNHTATAKHFHDQLPNQQDKFERILRECAAMNLSVRCEMIGGREFSIIIAPGLSAANYWIERFGLDVEER